jgi:hypothetical protein
MSRGMTGSAMDEPVRTTWRTSTGETAMDRAWRWCIERTLRDLELSIRRGRPITRPNLERLFCRRWAQVVSSGVGGGLAVTRRERDGRHAVRGTGVGSL